MKNTIYIIFFCFISQLIIAQKADLVNAPSNPTGFKWHKDHFELKGDIYASGEKIFDS